MSIQDDLFDIEDEYPQLVEAWGELEKLNMEYEDIICGLKRTIVLQSEEIGRLTNDKTLQAQKDYEVEFSKIGLG